MHATFESVLYTTSRSLTQSDFINFEYNNDTRILGQFGELSITSEISVRRTDCIGLNIIKLLSSVGILCSIIRLINVQMMRVCKTGDTLKLRTCKKFLIVFLNFISVFVSQKDSMTKCKPVFIVL